MECPIYLNEISSKYGFYAAYLGHNKNYSMHKIYGVNHS